MPISGLYWKKSPKSAARSCSWCAEQPILCKKMASACFSNSRGRRKCSITYALTKKRSGERIFSLNDTKNIASSWRTPWTKKICTAQIFGMRRKTHICVLHNILDNIGIRLSAHVKSTKLQKHSLRPPLEQAKYFPTNAANSDTKEHHLLHLTTSKIDRFYRSDVATFYHVALWLIFFVSYLYVQKDTEISVCSRHAKLTRSCQDIPEIFLTWFSTSILNFFANGCVYNFSFVFEDLFCFSLFDCDGQEFFVRLCKYIKSYDMQTAKLKRSWVQFYSSLLRNRLRKPTYTYDRF